MNNHVCLICTKSFTSKQSKRSYCSIACMRIGQKSSIPVEGTIVCNYCQIEKPVVEFRKNTRQCIKCRNAYEWEKKKERLRISPIDPEITSKYLKKYRYGITQEKFDQMLEEQNGVCLNCKQPERLINKRTGKPQRLSVDHDHACCPGIKTCGKCVRGLLCNYCNRLLGMIEQNPSALLSLNSQFNWIKS